MDGVSCDVVLDKRDVRLLKKGLKTLGISESSDVRLFAPRVLALERGC